MLSERMTIKSLFGGKSKLRFAVVMHLTVLLNHIAESVTRFILGERGETRFIRGAFELKPNIPLRIRLVKQPVLIGLPRLRLDPP